MAADAAGNKEGRANRPLALACRQCRSKHLKCDGLTPVCSRCSRQCIDCGYTPSRRGLRGRDAKPSDIARSTSCAASHNNGPASSSVASTIPLPRHANEAGACAVVSGSETGHHEQPQISCTIGFAPIYPDLPSAKEPNEQYLTNLYYSHFHPTHPFLVPRSRYPAQAYPSYLKLVVQFVGSHFAPNFSSYIRPETIEVTLKAVPGPSLALVQSLLLFAIALHSRNEREAAFKTIDWAASLAIELGMYHENYASDHGARDPLLEQSLRRTWWELYVIDGFFAALHRQTTFKCNTVELGAFLPCDEQEYFGGMQSSPLATLDQMDQRFFSLEDQRFSSGSYRIEAIRIIARVIAVISAGEDVADNIQAVDNAIVAWKYHLPHDKAGMIDRLGTFDQMMFQAHMFIHCAGILLHFSRSELLLNLPTIAKIACSERMTQASPTSNQHAHKAVTASKAISDLAALPADRYSPLFVCGLAFGCLVQLAVCSAHSCDCLTQHRERVALMIGVLKCMSREWPISGRTLQQLKRMASEVFSRKTALSSALSSRSLDSELDESSATNLGDWLDLFYPGDISAPGGPSSDIWDAS